MISSDRSWLFAPAAIVESKAFSDLFDEFAPSGAMSTDEFIKFCNACGAGKPNLPNHGIRTDKVKEIFSREELTADGKMPKSSFKHFYMESWKISPAVVWRDLKQLKFLLMVIGKLIYQKLWIQKKTISKNYLIKILWLALD